MGITRRDFLKYCSLSAAALGLSSMDLLDLKKALANPNGPKVLWLQGAACTGCSVSFLNLISKNSPASAADVLVNYINLVYHPNLSGLAGQAVAEVAAQTYAAGNYILIVEGGVPTAFNGATCWAWSDNGMDITFLEAATQLASRAKAVVAVGTCASFGGIPAAPPNPTQVKGVAAATGAKAKTVNIAGCPPHPDWIAWAVVQLFLGKTIDVDDRGRPTALFSGTVHSQCPRKEGSRAITYGVDGACLLYLGCQGPVTTANCPATKWNNQQNWCIDANARCLGCTEPGFPGKAIFNYAGGGNGEHDASFIQDHLNECQQCHHGNVIGSGDGGVAPPNPHGYTVNNCSSCHGDNVPTYNGGGGVEIDD
jgi:hydrogenase small subunit